MHFIISPQTEIFISVVLDIEISLGRINIFTILSLRICEYSISFPFFKVFHYFQQSIIVFSLWNLHIIRFIPQYFFVYGCMLL